jgi:curved DNA-binding protein CbpA
MKNLYEVLGVARDATFDDIKRAYRSLAQRHHPDKDGGDNALFQQIQEAYATLSDPEKRAAYDTTGKVPGAPPDDREKAIQLIMQTMDVVLDGGNPALQDVLKMTDDLVFHALSELERMIDIRAGKLERIRIARQRISAKAGRTDSIDQVVMHLEQSIEGPLTRMRAECATFKLAREILADHRYRVDTQQENTGPRYNQGFGCLYGGLNRI